MRLISTFLWMLILVSPAIAQNEDSSDRPSAENAATDSQDADDQEKPQLSEMELIERVSFLQRKLESAKVTDREEAEKELLELGPLVLDHLEPPTDNTPTDALQRISNVRLKLEKIAVAKVTESSKVTLKGEMTIREALAEIRNQTENDVAMPGETPDQLADKKVELNLTDVDFWVAVADVMKQGELIVDPYAGEPGQLRLTPTNAARVAAANPDLPVEEKKKIPQAPRNVSGVFDLLVTKVDSSRNLIEPSRNFCNITVMVRWEPRVQPISIELPVSSIKAIDEFDTPITVTNTETVLSGTVLPEIPELQFSVPIGLVDRQIEVIKSFEARIDAVLPGRIETFKFKNIGKLDDETEQRKAGAIVTFGGIRKNEDLFGVTVRLSFEEESNALESHQGWAFNNPIYLEDSEGKQHQAIAYETLRQDNEQIAIQFYFEHDPAEMTLVYKTPAAIVEVPVKISLKNIPLP